MDIAAPFGRMLTAMVTPFDKDGKIDWPGVEKLAAHLVASGHDGIAVNGTTGEAPTTKSSEKEDDFTLSDLDMDDTTFQNLLKKDIDNDNTYKMKK